jgi:hypothetical protein
MTAPAGFEQTVTGIPLWLLREYLEQLAGRVQADGSLAGDGWQATLTQVEDYRIGSLSVGRVRLEITGEAETVKRIRQSLEPKLLRAGG